MIYYIVNSNITPTIHLSSFEGRDNSVDVSIIGCIKRQIDMLELNSRLRARVGDSQDPAYIKRLIQLRILLMLMNHCESELDIVQQNF